ncbi:hypothetical protein MTO96_018686 [Rhipicephalus appendiculatus]
MDAPARLVHGVSGRAVPEACGRGGDPVANEHAGGQRGHQRDWPPRAAWDSWRSPSTWSARRWPWPSPTVSPSLWTQGNLAHRIDVTDARPAQSKTVYVDVLHDICRNTVPRNLMEAFIFTPYTVVDVNSTVKETTDISLEGQTPTIRRVNIPNYVGMTVVSVLLGAVLATMWESCRGFVELFVAVSDVMLNLGRMIMWYFPIGICFLLTSQTLRSHEFVSETRQLESYFLSLVLALAIHGMFTLPALLILFSRTHYRSLFSNIGLTLVTAFGTSSSNMTLTSTVSSLEDKVGLNPVVVRLVAPLGATFNKDGTAIYLLINIVFLAQRSGYHVTFLDFIATSTVTLIMSSATAAIPGQNETCIILTTRILSIPSQSVAVLILSDWVTDRLATVVNVLGDAVCCCIVDERCKHLLPGTSEKVTVPTEDSRQKLTDAVLSLRLQPFVFPEKTVVGTQVSATCTTVEAAQNVRFRWFKNGRLLTASERDGRIRLRTFPDVSTLVIGPLEENDSGNYTCTGTAGLKSDSYTQTLHVLVPPKWIHEPNDVDVREGENVTVTCSASGRPAPAVKWKRKVPVKWVQEPDDVSVKEAENTTLRCEATGIPKPSIRWEKEGVLLTASGSKLQLHKATKADSGTYKCTADNGLREPLAKEVRVSVYGRQPDQP